jgi:mannan endo-1,4-beta-mannosidase
MVTPNPLPVAQALYNTLLAQYGSKNIFSGQAGTDGVAWIQANLNTTPAIIGLDMIDYSPSRVVRTPPPQRFTWS